MTTDTADPPLQLVRAADYVTIPLAATITGYSEKAIRRKIDDGKWREGEVWKKAPDGRVLISIRGYARWVETGRE
jgi:predicted HNH restriction endonuclease